MHIDAGVSAVVTGAASGLGQAWSDHQHCIGGSHRRTSGAACLCGLQGRGGQHDPTYGERPLGQGHTGGSYRTGNFCNPHGRGLSRERHIVQNAFLNGELIRLDGATRMPPR